MSESLARALFGDDDPIGNRLRFGPVGRPLYTVTGVVADVKQRSLDSGGAFAMYVPGREWHWADRVRWLVVRTDRPAAEIVPELRSAIWSIDGDVAVVRAQTLARLVNDSEGRRRFALAGLLIFASATLALAALGLYGILSSAITDRSREMGVRLALGASPEGLLATVLGQGLGLAAIGTGLGLLGGLLGTRALDRVLFGVSRLDPLTWIAVVGLMAAVATLASWLPAARAARSDALEVLRAE